MSEIIEKYIEIAVSIFLYIVSASLTLTVLVFAREPIILQGSDKTFIESAGIQQLYENETYGYDILMMLMNVDDMAPYPKAIKINNTPVIKLSNEFIAYKMRNVSLIYANSGEYKLSDMLHYKVVSEEFVYNGPDAPYIHYTLEEVP